MLRRLRGTDRNMETHNGQIMTGRLRKLPAAGIWLALGAGLAVALGSVIIELCLASACRETAGYTFFGMSMGMLGISYFSLALLMLGLRSRCRWCGAGLPVLVAAGVGSELRLLWIQKFVIGSWCPLCVTICACIYAAALFLTAEQITLPPTEQRLSGRALLLAAAAAAAGLAMAFQGVRLLD